MNDGCAAAAGGASNASTDSEYTVYQFEVSPKYLCEALDRCLSVLRPLGADESLAFLLRCRFAQFFIKPLFAPDAISREIQAIESGAVIALFVSVAAAFLK